MDLEKLDLAMQSGKIKTPLVSVVVITYNHEKYIEECLVGMLSQQVDFPIEIIIGDDCSTDNTRSIIQEKIILNTDPLKSFELIFHPENLSKPPALPGKLNFMSCLEKAKGKYIALCDGDDYWIDPKKLQKQVDFLEKNKNYVICGHDIECINNQGQKIDYLKKAPGRRFAQKDIAIFNPFDTASVIFVNKIKLFPQWFLDCKLGDWAIFLLISQYGKAYILPDVMSVYRKHEGGTWSLMPSEQKIKNGFKQIQILKREFPQFSKQFEYAELNSRISQLYWGSLSFKDLFQCLLLILKSKHSQIRIKDVLYKIKNKLLQ